MKCMPLAWLLAAACLATALSTLTLARHGSDQEPSAREREIDELIGRLGSDSFEVREAATRRLKEREDAIPKLRRALQSADVEVARRAADILESYARREQVRAGTEMTDLARRGAVDQAVELFARRARWDDEAPCWRALADLADKLEDLERKTYGKASRRPDKRVALTDLGMLKSWRLKFTPAGRSAPKLWEGRCVLRTEEIEGEFLTSSLLVARKKVNIAVVNRAVILGGGPVDLCGEVSDSLVVCDGDCTVHGPISNSLVIARGTVRCRSDVRDSRVITCGDVQDVRPTTLYNSKLVDKEPHPLGFVKFFDPADVGIRVADADGGARVKEATKGKRFAAAGLRADDLVTAVNGTAVKDAETFRRLLRAGLAGEDEMVFKVRRAEAALEVRVPAKD